MPFLDFTAGDVLTAANVDTMFRQGVMTFADSSARDTALTGVLDEGMVAYLEDTNQVTIYTGAAWIVSAAGARLSGGSATGTTDGTGLLTVTHGMGATPTSVTVTPSSTNTAQGYLSNVGATTFAFRCFSAAGAAVTSASVTVNWIGVILP